MRLVLEDGRRAFVKAAGRELNPETPGIHRHEAGVLGALPVAVPAPRLLFVYDDGDWVALVLEDVDGRQPRMPWQASELSSVLLALARQAEASTPSPAVLPTFAEGFEGDLVGLRTLAADGHLDDLDPWLAAHIEQLAEIESRWPAASVGETMLHLDVRSDNILLADERVVFVDWPGAAIGAPWLDMLSFLPSVAVQGGPQPWEIFDDHPVARDAEADAVDAMLAALTGFFVERSRRPDPPGLPTVRRFQAAQGGACTRWLEHRLRL